MTAPRHKPARLPGDPDARARVRRMIRVDQAGEYGAKRIYQGQLAVLPEGEAKETVRHMAAQEEAHLAAFNAMLPRYRARPTALAPLWHAAGFALGAATAMMGAKAAMACTVAVESVIDQHYARQERELAALAPQERELAANIRQFRAEEQEHHNIGLAHGAAETPGYAPLTAAIRGCTRLAIWLSERV